MSALLLGVVPGCSGKPAPESAAVPVEKSAEQPQVAKEPAPIAPQVYEASADELLAARLPADQASEGWIRLFDGHTLYGWEITGAANWRIEDGSIVVDEGAKCLLCTSMPWQDFELELEYQADADTNSGVFLRTPLEPEDPALDCYEVNIAPADNPYPTAGLVKRQKADPVSEPESADAWRTMRMVLDGDHLTVAVDGKVVNDYTDKVGLETGRIGLQHNGGRIAFRNIRLKPIGLNSLLSKDLDQWTKYPEMPGSFTVTDDGDLHVQGGRTQLESKQSFGDFVLLAQYQLAKPEMNSGIFFRCIPGDEMMGYECQLSNEVKDGNPLAPADTGTGGIFKRQDARVVAGDADKFSTLVLVVHQQKIAAWVEGVQVSNWFDDRKADENPRRGLRLEPGTIMIQGHDPTTDAKLKQIAIRAIE
ncbi:hypothetical protein K227x_09700 [Rubripirellula lacrimiformis]|uniref:3-keto-alpha-glucoside-1,2-lyase/3-keto-2-hydroxy-glucal hydratase domain-containing protein n=1 Tax=Rubripirellula lacrimiformis TaxID=1930273 RepID=A0A517N636_9BACT|nr:DUF1080 domain-containing protein [Rubripirellula lacrimiformis]QDT02592.1 hypothetical protein K227x_09700 [Rubripirellula lacrimiformis]